VLPHEWKDADCHPPKTCALCGDTEGEPLTHQWQDATCLLLSTCALCGDTQGELGAHAWTDTTCTAPVPCTVCGTLEGIELTHQWQEGKKICESCGLDARSVDDKFVDDLSAGLEAHFSMIKADMEAANEEAKKNGKKTTTQRYFTPEMLNKYLTTEYEKVSPYKGQTFEDPEMAELAARYIEGLEIHLEEVKLVTETTHEVEQYTREGFHVQCEALYGIHVIKPVTVAEEYWPDLKAMLANGQVMSNVNDMLELVSFQNIATLYDGRDRYEAIVVNGTGLHFESFTFVVDQYGANGEVISSKTLTVEDWRPGEKEYFNFVADKGVVQLKVNNAGWMFPDGAAPEYVEPEAPEAPEAAE